MYSHLWHHLALPRDGELKPDHADAIKAKGILLQFQKLSHSHSSGLRFSQFGPDCLWGDRFLQKISLLNHGTWLGLKEWPQLALIRPAERPYKIRPCSAFHGLYPRREQCFIKGQSNLPARRSSNRFWIRPSTRVLGVKGE